jgi:hypothetical protein
MPRTIEKIQPNWVYPLLFILQFFRNKKIYQIEMTYINQYFVFENFLFSKEICSLRFQKSWQTLRHFSSVKCYFFLCLVLPDMLALQTA